ncbi:MAG: hypothetical protein P4L36_06700 [Holophaga sp.]|nr:hypothetical protein [Holophaga sp.]
MRKALVLLIALPACAQGVDRFWYVDVHRFAPDLSGHFRGVSDGSPISVDFRNDLALSRDQSKPGASLEYQGTRFGLELSGDVQTYAGSNLVPANITIEGQTYRANTLVTSSVRATNWNFNGTVRYLTWPQFWLGADLGVRYTTLELQASGANGFSGATATASYRANLPIPQVGPSLGFSAAGGRLVGRGMVHLLTYKGATYNHLGVDLRYFPISWLGIRVFGDAERFRVPDGSIKSDLDITLDRTGTGFGIVARF